MPSSRGHGDLAASARPRGVVSGAAAMRDVGCGGRVDQIRELGLAGYIYGHMEYSFLLGWAVDCGVYRLTSWAQNRNTINFRYPTGCPRVEKYPCFYLHWFESGTSPACG
jgi:hypothetical protein